MSASSAFISSAKLIAPSPRQLQIAVTAHGPASEEALHWAEVRADLAALEGYHSPQVDVAVRLNTNENSYPVPDVVVEAIGKAVQAELRDLNRYPDRDAVALRTDLAGYLGHGLSMPNVWAANGSNEVQQQLLQAFAGPGRTALGFGPSYSMHPLLAAGTGTRWIGALRDPDFGLSPESAVAQIAQHAPDLVFLCSPNNPTGTALGTDVVTAVYEAGEEFRTVVVVDEAYAEFSHGGTPTALTLLEGRPRLIVSRTMSKAFALAGARLGYFAAAPEVADAVRLVRLPYHLSAVTQATALAALRHSGSLLATVEDIKRQRDRIVEGLVRLGLRPAESDSNFVFFGGMDDSRGMWEALLRDGVLVRDVGIPGHLRVTAGTEEETSAFLESMERIASAR